LPREYSPLGGKPTKSGPWLGRDDPKTMAHFDENNFCIFTGNMIPLDYMTAPMDKPKWDVYKLMAEWSMLEHAPKCNLLAAFIAITLRATRLIRQKGLTPFRPFKGVSFYNMCSDSCTFCMQEGIAAKWARSTELQKKDFRVLQHSFNNCTIPNTIGPVLFM
jgi:hypothetical protein